MTIAVDCIADITAKIQLVTELSQKAFSVYSEEDLMDKTKLLHFPAVGVMYEGLVASDDPSRQGLAAELRVALVLLMDGKSIGNLDQKNEAARLLDEIRKNIRTTRSPSQHKWRFVSETPVGLVNNVLVYVQRWSTATPITN